MNKSTLLLTNTTNSHPATLIAGATSGAPGKTSAP